MKQKFLLKLLILLLVGWLFVTPYSVSAGGGTNQDPVEASASATSVVANGSSTISVTVYTYRYLCPDGYNYNTPNCPDLSVSTTKVGLSGKTLGIFTSATDITYTGTQTWGNGVNYVTTGSDGKAVFSVASSGAGSKELKVALGYNGEISSNQSATLNLTFTTPPVATTTPTPKKTTTNSAPAPAEPTAPETPKVATLEVSGQVITSTETIELAATESLILKGTTVPNGIVKLYIFSTPREVTVTADASGNWSYEVKDLEAGSHHVEAEVTDPTTNKTSTRATLASFTVAEPENTVVAAAPSRNLAPWFVAGGVLLAAVAAVGIWWWYKHRSHAQPPSPRDGPDSNSTIVPPTSPE